VKELNIKLLKTIQQWDPYKAAEFTNDAEAADVIQLVHSGINIEKLGNEIKRIYDHSFEDDISLSYCMDLAIKLHNLYTDSSCEL
jgi:hypothetical protein